MHIAVRKQKSYLEPVCFKIIVFTGVNIVVKPTKQKTTPSRIIFNNIYCPFGFTSAPNSNLSRPSADITNTFLDCFQSLQVNNEVVS